MNKLQDIIIVNHIKDLAMVKNEKMYTPVDGLSLRKYIQFVKLFKYPKKFNTFYSIPHKNALFFQTQMYRIKENGISKEKVLQ